MKITEGLGRALFFVVGAPKSGTTWVQLMLNGHAAIDCAGEGHFTDWLLEDVRGLLAKYNERQAFNNAFVYDDDGYFSGFTGKDFNALARFVFLQQLRKRDRKPAIRFQGDQTPKIRLRAQLVAGNLPRGAIYLCDARRALRGGLDHRPANAAAAGRDPSPL